MNSAVVDGGGIPSRAPGRGVDVSTNRSVAAFDITTQDLAENSYTGKKFYGIQGSNEGCVMVLAGAAGVSGGLGEQDIAVAEAAASAF